jgi:hypothetical protein
MGQFPPKAKFSIGGRAESLDIPPGAVHLLRFVVFTCKGAA